MNVPTCVRMILFTPNRMEKFSAIFRQPHWGIGENIVVGSPSPYKNMSSSACEFFQIRHRNIDRITLRGGFRPDNNQRWRRLGEAVKISALGAVGANKKIGFRDSRSSRSSSAIYPCNEDPNAFEKFVVVNFSIFCNLYSRVTKERSLSFNGSLVGVGISFPQEIAEYGKDASEYSGPGRRPVAENEIVDCLDHWMHYLLVGGIFCLAGFFFLCFVILVWIGFEQGRLGLLLLAPVAFGFAVVSAHILALILYHKNS